MIRIGLDLETHLIREGMLFPRMVCAAVQVHGHRGDLLDRRETIDWFRQTIPRSDVVWIAHNAPFDFGVMAAEAPETLADIFEAFESGRVRDTLIRQKLLDIAEGVFKVAFDSTGKKVQLRYDLASLLLRLTGDVLPKADTWQKHYAALDGIHPSLWPPDAAEYPLRDIAATLKIHAAQEARARAEGSSDGSIPDEGNQSAAAWALHLMAGWGVRTDPEMVERLADTLEHEKRLVDEVLRREGILRPDGTKDMVALRNRVEADFRGRGLYAPRTPCSAKFPEGQIQTGAEVLAECQSDPALLALADAAGELKLLSTYVPALRRGTVVPCTSRPNVLVDSGRTSWGDPNWQNPPRKGGIRECVIPRPGWVFAFCDLDTAELRALAQECLELFKYSELAEVLRRGEDPHLALGADLLGTTYADIQARYKAGDGEAADARQSGKSGNFGFPGGMGVAKFLWAQRDFVKKLKARNPQFDEVTWAADLREAWINRFHEMREYFALASRATAPGMDCRMIHTWSGRVRGGLDYCSYANSRFQGRVADGAKLALRRVSRACYVERQSPLFGCRPVLFLHDEIGLETPEERASEAADELSRVMVAAVSEVIPDVPITAKPVLVRRWWKGAEALRVDGRLVPVAPIKDDKGKTTWKSA